MLFYLDFDYFVSSYQVQEVADHLSYMMYTLLSWNYDPCSQRDMLVLGRRQSYTLVGQDAYITMKEMIEKRQFSEGAVLYVMFHKGGVGMKSRVP